MGFEDSVRGRWKSFQVADEEPEIDPEVEEPKTQTLDAGTFIGTGALFEGTLALKGDFCIDSEFHGALTTDGTITVGPAGSVQGDIQAREVIIEGAVVGNVAARRQLIVKANARLHGDIETACLEIEKHAFFQGSTSMTRPYADARPTPSEDAVAPAFNPS
jgi:cytoskeletal protein CcmA (bactofilin family)